MRKGKLKALARVALVLLCVGGLVLLAWEIFRPKEISYKGKTPYEWIEIYQGGGVSAEWKESEKYVVSQGTNLIPHLLKCLGTSDSPIKRALVKNGWCGKTAKLVGCDAAYQRWANQSETRPRIAFEALRLLRPSLQPAPSDLLQILRSGKNPNSRMWTARYFEEMRDHAQEFLPALLEAFKDQDPNVRSSATEAVIIISQGMTPAIPGEMESYLNYTKRSVELMAPVAAKLLTDPKTDSKVVIWLLSDWHWDQGSVALPELAKLLNHPDPLVRARATNAIEKIRPFSLRPPSTNSVATNQTGAATLPPSILNNSIPSR